MNFSFFDVCIFGVCVDIDECVELAPCSGGRACVNTVGSYFCLPMFNESSVNVSFPPVPLSGDGSNFARVVAYLEPGTSLAGLGDVADGLFELGLSVGPADQAFAFEVLPLLDYTVSTGELVLTFPVVAGDSQASLF